MSQLACAYCSIGADEKPLDLDVAATPPVHSCRRCLKRPRCTRCHRRVHSVTIHGTADFWCPKCVRQIKRDIARAELVKCTKCKTKINITTTDDNGRCVDCSWEQMRADYPTVFARHNKET